MNVNTSLSSQTTFVIGLISALGASLLLISYLRGTIPQQTTSYQKMIKEDVVAIASPGAVRPLETSGGCGCPLCCSI